MITWNTQDLAAVTTADWNENIVLWADTLSPLPNLAGATYKMQVKHTVEDPDVYITLIAELTIDIPTHTVKLAVDNSVMKDFSHGEYIYDILVILSDGKTLVGAKGKVKIYAGVTRQ